MKKWVFFTRIPKVGLDEAQRRLPEGGLLLEYFIAGEDILAFAVTGERYRVLQLPLSAAELRRAFKFFGSEQSGRVHNLTPAADGRLHSPFLLHNLYQRLVKPFAAELAAAQWVCIVPHGLLHYLPFHAFYEDTAQGRRFLDEMDNGARPVFYAPSATVLLDYCNNKPPSTQSGCLALGYNRQSLTQAEAEAQAVVEIMGGRDCSGVDATRAALQEWGARHRYIHLSCHGDFRPGQPTLSSLSLADGDLDVVEVLRSYKLNADLVCLSACETGRHAILRGDELIGLTRAFLYAGTPAVMVSHWRVDEFSTRLLMAYFYTRLREVGVQAAGAALALAQAQQALRNLTLDDLHAEMARYNLDGATSAAVLQRIAAAQGAASIEALTGESRPFAHPYYWAPFFIVGERCRA